MTHVGIGVNELKERLGELNRDFACGFSQRSSPQNGSSSNQPVPTLLEVFTV